MAKVNAAEAGAAAAFWVDQVGQQVENISDAAAKQGAAVWDGFTAWYAADQVAERAAQAAQVSLHGQETVAQIMAQYLGEMTAILHGRNRITIPKIGTPDIRNGADPLVVHARAAKAYRLDYAETKDSVTALLAAQARERELIETDLMLAARQAQEDAMRELDVVHYRRVLHPELSRTGSCGLCLAASLQVYKVGKLMPIHVHCKCVTMPVIGQTDPADALNEADRKAAYAEAGATGKTDLSHVRVQVHEHGELGPVVTVKGQKFTGPNDLKATGSGSNAGSGGSGSGSGSGNGSGEPPADDGSRHLPHDQSVVYSGELRASGDVSVPTYSDLDRRGLIGDQRTPGQYFTPEEQAIADWLAGRGVNQIRSVREINEKDLRTPDAVLDDVAVTVEFKALEDTNTADGIDQAIRRGRGQSRRIVIDGRDQGVDAVTAAAGIKKALGKYGAQLDEVVVILADGTSVGWWHGRR